MDQPESLKLIPAEKTTNPVKKITDQALTWHDKFNHQYWENKPSYHNRIHIRAAITAAKAMTL
jgi:hypothetical protein